MDYELTHKDGKPYVMIPFHEYRTMEKEGTFTKPMAPSNSLSQDLMDTLASSTDHPIKIIRKHQGLTQQALAEKAGISRPFLTEIETGKKNGSVQALKQVADALDVSLDIIIRD